MESLLGPGGLVLLRGEGHRHGGSGAGFEGRKWSGRALGHRLGVVVATVRESGTFVLTLLIRPSLSPDSVEWEGRSLLKALIKQSALR